MNLPHVTSGQPWRPNAAKENAWTDAANDFAARRSILRPGGKADRKIWDAGAVWVKNVSASNYDRYSVVGLRDPIFTDPAQAAFSQFTGFEVSSPSDPSSPFAIIQEPLPIGVANRIGVTEGITPARVLINDPDHGYASPVSGETGFLESTETGPAEILWKESTGETRWALVRVGPSAPEGFPDILRIVTNVCPVGESAGNRFTAADNYEISTSGGQAIVVGSINAKAGITSVRAVVDWADPDFEAGTGDSFSFYLIADGTNYTGAPPHLVTFVGNGASMQKEMVWNVLLSEDKTINLALWAYRISGSRSLVASTTSRLEVNSDVAGTKVEYRQLILNGGAHVGPKICVTNPADCCIDDESSTQDTGSDLTVTCCSVPVPSMRSVDLSGMVSFASGWFAVGFGYYANYDYLIGRVRDELNKLHYLPYIGEIVDTRTRCLYEKTISIPDAYVLSYFGFPTEETEGSTEYIPSFSIRLRFFISERLPGESSPFYDWNLSGGVPVGYIAAGEYQAHCGLSLEYFTDGGPWAGLAAFTGVYTPHYSNEFYATQPVGTYPRLRNGNLPDPGTSCAGACSLYLVQGTLTNGSYEGEAGPTAVGYPLTASVEAV